MAGKGTRFVQAAVACAALGVVGWAATGSRPVSATDTAPGAAALRARAGELIEQGRRTFRYDTFGDEAFWGGQLRLHQAIAGSSGGGVGPGLSPRAALGVGLKVDVESLPAGLVQALRAGKVDLDDPAATLVLLRSNAVVGVRGFFDGAGRIRSVGIQCALCHSTVDDSFAPGIGRRRDGWANRDLDVGAIVALAPDLTPFTTLLGVSDAAVRTVLRSWGPGRFDAALVPPADTRPSPEHEAQLGELRRVLEAAMPPP